MGKETGIEWCDSTGNLQAGCDGCELWIPGRVRLCYAGIMTAKYAGLKGWPKAFYKPEIFADRLEEFLAWPDLTGNARPLKPWLDGLPRIVFLNDMGDTFTPSLPKDWLKPFLPRMADSPHQWLILTKQSAAMLDFESRYPFPKNVWPGVSVTSRANVGRIDHLVQIKSGGPKWISYEPALGPVDWSKLDPSIAWLIAGGLSGADRPTPIEWLSNAIHPGRATFVKQLGSVVHESYYLEDEARREVLLDGKHRVMIPSDRGGFYEWNHRNDGQPNPRAVIEWKPKDKGGNVEQWPNELRVRQMPKFEFAPRVEAPAPAPAARPSRNQGELF